MKHKTIQQLRDNLKKVLKRARPKQLNVASGPIYANINFCPMFGRKLAEESDAEG